MDTASIPLAASVVIAEADRHSRLFLAKNLAADGYRPVRADTAVEVLARLREDPVDALLVDVGADTPGLLDQIRQELHAGVDPQLPVLALTGGGCLHRTRLLERGADDVLAKPYSYPELRARLAALLRRAHARRQRSVPRVGSLRVDVAAHRVWIGEVEVALRAKEYELLLALLADPCRVFTRQELLRDVWGIGPSVRTRTLDSHAARLRSRLTAAGDDRFVRTVWGIGYRLTDGPLPTEPAVLKAA